MCHQRGVIAVHRTWRVEQHGQQILPDIPNPRCILLQAVRDETDMLAVQLQQLRPHDLGRVVIACNADSAARAANLSLIHISGSHADRRFVQGKNHPNYERIML